MMLAHLPDAVITAFVDSACSDETRASVAVHLTQCPACRSRVAAEADARAALQARAAEARRLQVAPAFRPRVWRLGQPMLPAGVSMLVALPLIAGIMFAMWPARAASSTVGVVGDSYCAHMHRFTTRFDVSDTECTLGCVQRGAEFVLVTDAAVYRIRNQEFASLAAHANQRVRIVGPASDNEITVSRIEALK
jgi:hypothetical protein